VNALCIRTLYDRRAGTELTLRAFLNFTPTGDESKDHAPAPAALPSEKDLPDRRVGGLRGLSECGDEEN
jgi:hypothetical protein